MEWSRREVLGTVVGSVGAATAASAWQSSAPKPQPKERQRPANEPFGYCLNTSTIRGNQLVTVSCGTPVTMPMTLSVQGGKFAFAGEGFLTMTGSLTATTAAVGQVMAPGCGDGMWWAEKASSPTALSNGALPFIASGR